MYSLSEIVRVGFQPAVDIVIGLKSWPFPIYLFSQLVQFTMYINVPVAFNNMMGIITQLFRKLIQYPPNFPPCPCNNVFVSCNRRWYRSMQQGGRGGGNNSSGSGPNSPRPSFSGGGTKNRCLPNTIPDIMRLYNIIHVLTLLNYV